MPDTDLVTRLATAPDIDAVVALLQANEVPAGGALTGHFDHATVAAMLTDMPAIVARRGAHLAGVVLLGSRAAASRVPILVAMLAAYRGDDDAYLYGPVCVAASDRGRNGDQNAAVHAYSPGAALQWHDGRSIRRGRRAHPSAVSLLRTGAEVFGARHRITPTSGDALARRVRHGTHPYPDIASRVH